MLNDPSYILLVTVLQDVVLFVLTVGLFWAGVSVARGLFKRQTSYSLVPLGFSAPRSGYFAGARMGLLAGFGAVIASLVIAPLSLYILDALGYSTESSVQGPFKEGLSGWVGENPGTAIPAIIAVVVLFGPAVEELIFRGAIFGGLYRLSLLSARRLSKNGGHKETGERVSFALAALLSSTLFALIHLEPVALPVLFVLAVGLCALYRHTRSLLPCLIAHATFNSFAALLIILDGLGALPAPV